MTDPREKDLDRKDWPIPTDVDDDGRSSFLVKLQEGLWPKGRRALAFGLERAKRHICADIQIDPALTEDVQHRIKELVARASVYSPFYEPPDFTLYFKVTYSADQSEVWEDLITLPGVAVVQAVRRINSPTLYLEDPYVLRQGYLATAPEGIGAKDVWDLPGGQGKGVRFVDVEEGWAFEHEEILPLEVKLIHGVNNEFAQPHGTAVLGIVAARENGVGITGVAPSLDSVSVSSVWEKHNKKNLPLAIVRALEVLRPGDVLLIEIHIHDGYIWLPIEMDILVLELIRLGSALGITVIEPAGNGAGNLDTHQWPKGHPILIDSGAVIVGACHPHIAGIGHEIIEGSNYGKRVGCYAWGYSIYSASVAKRFSFHHPNGRGVKGDDVLRTYGSFSATSGASAIVAGAAACIQGMARARLDAPLSPTALRNLLYNVKINTPVTRKEIILGAMPNLSQIATVLEQQFRFKS